MADQPLHFCSLVLNFEGANLNFVDTLNNLKNSMTDQPLHFCSLIRVFVRSF